MEKELPKVIAGVDEAGRGPLAGPVIACAVILNPLRPITGLKDSKLLSATKREYLYKIIQENCLAWSIGRAEAEEIDIHNIHNATLLAMRRAVEGLAVKPTEVLVDGKFCPEWNYISEAIIKGDQKISEISAASIIAKVTRDKEMEDYDRLYPGYGFAIHKGYPTKAHMEALNQLGISPIHRKSYGPVKAIRVE